MTTNNLLTVFEQRIGEINPSANRLLFIQQALDSAKSFIEREGITLEYDATTGYTVEDAELILMYGEYLIKKRDTGESMPRMLRYALNNRLFSEVSADET